jgi:hypothetical protein
MPEPPFHKRMETYHDRHYWRCGNGLCVWFRRPLEASVGSPRELNYNALAVLHSTELIRQAARGDGRTAPTTRVRAWYTPRLFEPLGISPSPIGRGFTTLIPLRTQVTESPEKPGRFKPFDLTIVMAVVWYLPGARGLCLPKRIARRLDESRQHNHVPQPNPKKVLEDDRCSKVGASSLKPAQCVFNQAPR